MLTDSNTLNKMLETAADAARLAGQHAMQALNKVKVTVKNKSELVTEADSHCQQIIIDRIRRDFPGHGFIAEEGTGGCIFKIQPDPATPFWWVIDPIDGTHNFAHQMLLFVVSIAAMYEGRPVVGAIYDPSTNSMFTGIEKGPAQMNGKPISVSDEDINIFSHVGIDSNFDDGVPACICRILEKTRFRNLGATALQLSYVAKGGLVATIASRQKLWDVAAGLLIAKSAGGVISNWQKQPIFPVELDDYTGQQLQIVAANPKAYPQILQLLK